MNNRVTLSSGEDLTIRMIEPPLRAYTDKVGCWLEVRDDLLSGNLTPWLFTPYFVGEIDGKLVGSMSYYVHTEKRSIGVVEFVQTGESHRGKGIANALMHRLIKRFRKDGGQALYLCTNNPIAGHLYERHGFSYHVGDGMRYLAPDFLQFDETYWRNCGEAVVRNATWGDLPALSALYNHPEPNWLIKDYLTSSFSETRYESHFVKVMRRIENGRGSFSVLENPKGNVVGAAAIERKDTFVEQHVGTLGFRITPEYESQLGELLLDVEDRARSISIRTLQIPMASCDHHQCELVRAAGFEEEVRLKDRLRLEEGYVDLLVFGKTTTDTVKPFREVDSYYGTRKKWQAKRARSLSL